MSYNVQCLNGHVGVAPPDSSLEQRCKEREAHGKLDALCLSWEECPGCQYDRQGDLRRSVEMCGDFGCPLNENTCKDGCIALRELRECNERIESIV